MPTNECKIDNVSSTSLLSDNDVVILNSIDLARYTNVANYFMGQLFRNHLIHEGLTVSDLVSNSTNIGKTYENVRQLMADFVVDNAATLSQKAKDDIARIIEKDNWKVFKKHHLDNNILVSGDTDFIKEEEGDVDEGDYAAGTAVETGGEESVDDDVPEDFKERGNRESTFDLMSNAMRTLFKLLPKSEITHVDETGITIEEVRDRDGLPMVADFDNIFNLLSERLSGIKDYNEFVAKITSLDVLKVIPEIKYLNEMMKFDAETRTQGEITQLVSFHSVFSRPTVEIWSSTFTVGEKTKNFIYYKAVKGNKRKIEDYYINNFRTGNIDDALLEAHTIIDDRLDVGLGRRRIVSIPSLPMKVNSDDIVDTSKEALDFLQLIGFKFSGINLLTTTDQQEEFANVINDAVANIHNSLSRRLLAKDNIFDPFKDLQSPSLNAAGIYIEDSWLNTSQLVDLESKYSKFSPSLSTKNTDGENQYEISQNNALTIAIYYLNKAQTLKELNESPTFMNLHFNPLFYSSHYKDLLFDAKGNRRVTVDRTGKTIPRYSIKVRNYNGYKVNDMPFMTRKLTKADKFSLDFMNLLQHGALNTMQLESKSSAYSINVLDSKGVSVVMFNQNNFKGSFIETQQFMLKVFDYMKAEIARIKTYNQKKIENPNLTEKYEDLSIMSQIIDDNLKKQLIAEEDITPTSNAGIAFTKAAQDYFQKQADAIVKFATESGFDLDTIVSDKMKEFYGEQLYDANNAKMSEKGAVNVENLARMFVGNAFVTNVEFAIYIGPDPLFIKDYHKRLGMIASTGSLTSTIAPVNDFLQSDDELIRNSSYGLASALEYEMRDNSVSYQSAVMRELTDPTNTYATGELIDGFVASMKLKGLDVSREAAYDMLNVKDAKNVAVGDGQGYITIDFHRELSFRQGFWTEDLEIAYKYEGLLFRKQEGLLDESGAVELAQLEHVILSEPDRYAIPTLKYTTVSPILNTTVNMMAGDKFSLHPIRPSYTKNHPEMGRLNKVMLKRQIGYMKFQSGTKLSVRHVYEGIDDLETSETEPDLLVTELLKEQLKTKIGQKTESITPTQFIKLLFSNLFEEGAEISKAAKSLRDKFIDFLNEIKDQQTIKLLDELGFQMSEDGKKILSHNPVKLIEKIKKEIVRQNLNSNVLESLKLKDGKFVYDLESSGAMRQIMDYLTGAADKFLRRYKTNQADFVLISSAYQNESKFVTPDGLRSRKLKYMGYNPNGKTHIMECRITLTKEFAKLLNLPDPDAGKIMFNTKELNEGNMPKQRLTIGTMDRLNELLKDPAFVEKNRKSLTVVFSRVPIQSPGSTGTAIVTEFIFPTAGNVLQLPVEFMHQAGIDFDYDKEKVMMPNLSKDGRYVPHNLKSVEEDIQKLKDERYEKIKELKNYKQMSDNPTINSMRTFMKEFKQDLKANRPYFLSEVDKPEGKDPDYNEQRQELTRLSTYVTELYIKKQQLAFIRGELLRNVQFDEEIQNISEPVRTNYLNNESEFDEVVLEIDNLIDEWEGMVKKITNREYFKVINEGFEYKEKINKLVALTYLTRESTVNKLTSLSSDVLLLPELFSEIVLPNNNANIKAIAKKNGKDLGMTTDLPVKGQVLEYLKNLDVFNIYYTAKALLGPYAISNVFHQLVAQQGTKINYAYNLGKDAKSGITPNYVNLNLMTREEANKVYTIGKGGKRQLSISSLKDVNDAVIQHLLSQIINATVDSAKDPYFAELNQTWQNINETAFMLHLRHPMSRIVEFTNNPLILKLGKLIAKGAKKQEALEVILKDLGITNVDAVNFVKAIDSNQTVEGLDWFEGVNYATDLSDERVLARLKINKREGDGLSLIEPVFDDNMTQDTFDNLRLLSHFYMMGAHAQEFRNFKSLFNNDTTKVTSLLQIVSKEQTRENLLSTGMFNVADVRAFENRSLITPFRNDDTIKMVIKYLFKVLSREDVLRATSKIIREYNKVSGSNTSSKRILPKVIENDFIAAILGTYGKYKGFNFTEYGRTLVGKHPGNTTLSERLSALRKKDFYPDLIKNFPVIDKFRPESKLEMINNKLFTRNVKGEEQATIPHSVVLAIEKDTTVVQQEDYITQLRTILEEDFGANTELVHDLVKDIFVAGLIQSGINDSGIGFYKYIPNEFKAQLLQDAMTAFSNTNPSEFLSAFVKRFMVNNPRFFKESRTVLPFTDTHLGKDYNLSMSEADREALDLEEKVFGSRANPYVGVMDYNYNGEQREDVLAQTTFEAIQRGERTSSTRYESQGKISYWQKPKEGDYIMWKRGADTLLTVVTKPLYRLKDANMTPEEWSKLEGWSVKRYHMVVEPRLDEAWQLQYRLATDEDGDNNNDDDTGGDNGGNDTPSKTPTFDTLPSKSDVPTMTYAGIGSRETPPEALKSMTEVARELESRGYALRSGGAKGADSAFEKGVQVTTNKQIFPGSLKTGTKELKIAREIHPNPEALDKSKNPDFVWNLMGRNTNQVFGKDLNSPVDFVVFYAKETSNPLRPEGGTGQAVEMARRKGIPTVNLASPNWRQELDAILGSEDSEKKLREYTPENITSLKANEVFVFGSNAEGAHGKGAALIAKEKFGAKQGQAEGLQGNSYAVITKKDWRVEKSSTLPEIGKQLQNMVLFAKAHPELKFYVTKVGSSLAGYTLDEIKALFKTIKKFIPDNVILPKEYEVRDDVAEEKASAIQEPIVVKPEASVTDVGQYVKFQDETYIVTKVNANGTVQVYNPLKEGTAAKKSVATRNLSIVDGKAKIVPYRGTDYIVTPRDTIISMKTNKKMDWADNDGNRQYILRLTKEVIDVVEWNKMLPQVKERLMKEPFSFTEATWSMLSVEERLSQIKNCI